MLFESVIFGPIKSRRLGISLVVNLLPATAKVCSFNCIYCECGFNFTDPKAHLPSLKELETQLEQTLERMVADNKKLDSITFAATEPTMHPQFAATSMPPYVYAIATIHRQKSALVECYHATPPCCSCRIEQGGQQYPQIDSLLMQR